MIQKKLHVWTQLRKNTVHVLQPYCILHTRPVSVCTTASWVVSAQWHAVLLCKFEALCVCLFLSFHRIRLVEHEAEVVDLETKLERVS